MFLVKISSLEQIGYHLSPAPLPPSPISVGVIQLKTRKVFHLSLFSYNVVVYTGVILLTVRLPGVDIIVICHLPMLSIL